MPEGRNASRARRVRTGGRVWPSLVVLVIGSLFQGCGLLMDAIQLIQPVVLGLPNEVDVICRHQRVQVGIAVEAFPPFVFPVVWTDQGPWVTGLDVELVRTITAAVSKHCGGTPVTPVVHLVHVRDLFLLLNEGKIDFFVSALAYNVAHPTATGLGFSTPYFYDAGIGGVTKRPEVVERVRAALHQSSADGDILTARKGALAGLIVAAQESRSPYLYAQANLKDIRLVACDTLSAAFESQDPPVDVILGKQPILDFVIRHYRPDWQALVLENGQPFLLTHELFTVVMAENSFRLQWLVNDLLFQLEQSGRLAAMHRRWFEEDYTYIQRATSEGLLSTAVKDIQANGEGRCRWTR